MPDNRTDSLVQLAQDTARRITGSHTAWMAYLQTAARLYKYPYHEQLLIFAQRPQATACAGYEVWKNTMRRYVRRGAKGIALLDTSGDAPRLRYVFDVADTGELSQSRSLNLWKLSEENAQAVSLSLENGYDVPAREALDVRWALTCMELEDEVERLEAVLSPVLLRRAQAKLWQAPYYHYDYAQPWLPQLEANLHGLKADWAKLTAYQQKQNVQSK